MKRNPKLLRHSALEVLTLPVLRDNYIFLLRDTISGVTAAVDPAEAEPVLRALEDKNWQLNYILNTHHHHDHVGGNLELKRKTGCKVVGYAEDAARIVGIDIMLGEGERFAVGDAVAEVIFVPGHTLGHIAYYFAGEKILFCGDALFLMGCGRLFEGTAKQAFASLMRLAALPDDTSVYCTHEYTQANGKFALTLEPENSALIERMQRVREIRRCGEATIPGNISEEKLTNPFLRCAGSDAIRRNLGMAQSADAVAVFAELRKRKDEM